MKIAIQGEPGSFSHEAAIKLVPDATIVPCALSADVFAALANGKVDAAVIPIENSLAGSVSEHFDLLLAHDVKVERETLLRIRHNLDRASPGPTLGDIDRVFSHPVALAQCRRFLAATPTMEAFAFYDTAGSVKQLVELATSHAAAIASEAARTIYGARFWKPTSKTIRRTTPASSWSGAQRESVPDPARQQDEPGLLRREPTRLAGGRPLPNSPPSAPTSPRSSRARCTASPGSTFSMWIARFNRPTKVARALDALDPHCAMVKELGRYQEARSSSSRTIGQLLGSDSRKNENGDRPIKPVPAFATP